MTRINLGVTPVNPLVSDVSVLCVFKPGQTNQMKRSIEPGLDLIWPRLQVSKQLQQLRITRLVCLLVLRVTSKSLRSLN